MSVKSKRWSKKSSPAIRDPSNVLIHNRPLCANNSDEFFIGHERDTTINFNAKCSSEQHRSSFCCAYFSKFVFHEGISSINKWIIACLSCTMKKSFLFLFTLERDYRGLKMFSFLALTSVVCASASANTKMLKAPSDMRKLIKQINIARCVETCFVFTYFCQSIHVERRKLAWIWMNIGSALLIS